MQAEEHRLREAYSRRTKGDKRYSFFNPSNLFTVQERERAILRILGRELGEKPLSEQKILEVGCGSGTVLSEFLRWGARADRLSGVDLLANSIGEARMKLHSSVSLQCQNIASLQFANETFDLVVQSTVFSSILDPNVRKAAASEMLRVCKKDGLILWYDFFWDNPRNPDVRGVKRHQILELFPHCTFNFEKTSLAPPLARSFGFLVNAILSKIPILRTHYLVTIRKQAS